MFIDLLVKIKYNLCKIREKLWNINDLDDVLNKVLKRLLLLKA
jgi:hypothetical protein